MTVWHIPDPTYDPTAPDITAITAALAAMIGTVLEPLGWDPRYSHSLPPEQLTVDPGCPVAVHVGGSDVPIPIAFTDSCIVQVQYTIHSYYFITPLTAERAEAWPATQAWLLPILRAHFANLELGGLVEVCRPVQAQWIGEMPYGDVTYTGLLVTSQVVVNYQMEFN